MTEIKVFQSIQEFIKARDSVATNQTVGFVPTMGALHEGHASLIRQSASENTLTVVSIYINPTQFNNPEDLKKYPRTWEADLELARRAGAWAVLTPNYDDIYADGYLYRISENDFSTKLCGAHRPGHFDGVLTVVMKLLQIVQPTRAYFGEKDYQQLELIRGMAQTFFMRSQIVAAPTVREHDGLAMSSRNVRLSTAGREKAPIIYRTLQTAKAPAEARAQLTQAGVEVEYLEEHNGRRFIAAFIDGVRLIDNVEITK